MQSPRDARSRVLKLRFWDREADFAPAIINPNELILLGESRDGHTRFAGRRTERGRSGPTRTRAPTRSVGLRPTFPQAGRLVSISATSKLARWLRADQATRERSAARVVCHHKTRLRGRLRSPRPAGGKCWRLVAAATLVLLGTWTAHAQTGSSSPGPILKSLGEPPWNPVDLPPPQAPIQPPSSWPLQDIPPDLPGDSAPAANQQPFHLQLPELVAPEESWEPPPDLPRVDRLQLGSPEAQLETDPVAWWSDLVAARFRPEEEGMPVDVTDLYMLAVQHSQRIQAVQQTPWISGTQIMQAEGAFDPRLWNTTDFNSSSDPAENTLATGGPPRLEDDIVGIDGGLRGQTRRGTTYSLGQRLGHKNSNSLFFEPNDQGSARLYASWTKPLLRGRQVNPQQSLVLVARFDTAAEQAKYLQAVQSQLFEVSDAYWTLYVERATLLLRQRNLTRAEAIAEQLRERQSLDTVRNQLLRARGAVANRRAELGLSEAKIRNQESRLRALINAPGISDQPVSELLPVQEPVLQPLDLDIEAEVAAAVARRPEIQELRQKLKAKGVQLALARDQAKAQLNFVLEGNLAGLAGSSDIFRSWVNQFSTGRPGFAAGLQYELPYRNRTARGVVRQTQLEMNQLQYLLGELLANIRAEVETSIRNVQAAYETAVARRESVAAVTAEVDYLEDRWRTLGNDPRLGQLQLNDLLDAHSRLLQEEQNLLQASTQYCRALVELQHATGSLVRFAQ